MSSAMISCHVQVAVSPTPGALRAYSSQGGSIRTTSNFVPKVAGDRESFFRSAYRAAGGRTCDRRSGIGNMSHLLCLGCRRGGSVCLWVASNQLKQGCSSWFTSTCTAAGRHRAQPCVSVPPVSQRLQDNPGAKFAALVEQRQHGRSSGEGRAPSHFNGMQPRSNVLVVCLQNT